MSRILDHLAAWRDEDGPELWRESAERVLQLYSPVFQDPSAKLVASEENNHIDGARAVTLGIYMIARTRGIAPAAVTRSDLEPLLRTWSWNRVRVWEELLREAGHDPASADDPLAVHWRKLRRDVTPPHADEISDEAWEDGSFHIGPVLGFAPDLALAPRWDIALDPGEPQPRPRRTQPGT